MEQLKFCRICLVTDVSMYSLDVESGHSLGLVYSQLTEIQICGKCQHVCYECTSLLRKFHFFKLKCHRAHRILSEISENAITLTKRMIKKIDRKENNLESNLIFTQTMCYETDKDLIKKYPTILNDILNDDDKIEIDIKPENSDDNTTDETKEIDFKDDVPDSDKKDIIKKEYKNKTINIIYGNQTAKTHSTLELIKTSLDDFDNDFTEYLDENILAEVEEPVTDTSKADIVEKPNILHDDYKYNDFKNHIYRNICKMTKVDYRREFEGYGTVVSLTPEDARNEILERKNSTNYKLSPFKCKLCYRGFRMNFTYENHMKRHNPEIGEYECDICHWRFSNSVRMRIHLRVYHMRKFICKLCTFTCFSMEQAKAHVSLHKGVTYPCNYCGETFTMSNSLDSHKRHKHLNDSVTEFVCDICGNIFASNTGILVHKNKLHKLDKNSKQGPECEECGVHFDSEKAWSRHLVLSSKHAKALSDNNICKFCGERFTDEDDLRSHIRENHIHTQTKRIKLNIKHKPNTATCRLCDQSVSGWRELDMHMREIHPGQHIARRNKSSNTSDAALFVCETCGLAFRFERQLMEHQRAHTGERPFKCDQCDKRYRTKTILYIHRKKHDNLTYICNTCGRVLGSKSALEKHIRLHKGIRPHKCLVCNKAFPHLCELKTHIKYVHEKVPWPKRIRKRNVRNNNI